MLEYIDRNIKAENTCNDLFIIEGAETDGWLIQNCDCDKLLKEIRNQINYSIIERKCNYGIRTYATRNGRKINGI